MDPSKQASNTYLISKKNSNINGIENVAVTEPSPQLLCFNSL